MEKIRVHICSGNTITNQGITSFLNDFSGVEITGECANSKYAYSEIAESKANVVFLDFTSESYSTSDIGKLKDRFADLKIIGITGFLDRLGFKKAMECGIDGYILNCCSEEEVQDAVVEVHKGNRFFCGKILACLKEEKIDSCDAISLSDREIEIIGLIAEGYKNKEIAERLYLSPHTVMTHRKNIMSKLGLNNTAGIVIYAVKEGIIGPNRFLFSYTSSN